ncbi:MAG: trpB 1, partial [Chloroflexi bacterium]|nr:trpB 1 [Chloroflexota bacterium]
MAQQQVKFVLDESRIPRAWYNIAADLPAPAPPALHPGTGQPLGPEDLAPLFPMALIAQEVSTEREIEIPDPVREAYRLYRPTPLQRAVRLERVL